MFISKSLIPLRIISFQKLFHAVALEGVDEVVVQIPFNLFRLPQSIRRPEKQLAIGLDSVCAHGFAVYCLDVYCGEPFHFHFDYVIEVKVKRHNHIKLAKRQLFPRLFDSHCHVVLVDDAVSILVYGCHCHCWWT